MARSYTIQIAEFQRAAILKALESLDPSLLPEIQESEAVLAAESPQQELIYLINMFRELPASESEDPGALHGFCL